MAAELPPVRPGSARFRQIGRTSHATHAVSPTSQRAPQGLSTYQAHLLGNKHKVEESAAALSSLLPFSAPKAEFAPSSTMFDHKPTTVQAESYSLSELGVVSLSRPVNLFPELGKSGKLAFSREGSLDDQFSTESPSWPAGSPSRPTGSPSRLKSSFDGPSEPRRDSSTSQYTVSSGSPSLKRPGSAARRQLQPIGSPASPGLRRSVSPGQTLSVLHPLPANFHANRNSCDSLLQPAVVGGAHSGLVQSAYPTPVNRQIGQTRPAGLDRQLACADAQRLPSAPRATAASAVAAVAALAAIAALAAVAALAARKASSATGIWPPPAQGARLEQEATRPGQRIGACAGRGLTLLLHAAKHE
eukprot:3219081-Pleurochrysis_carterae.AAC.1